MRQRLEKRRGSAVVSSDVVFWGLVVWEEGIEGFVAAAVFRGARVAASFGEGSGVAGIRRSGARHFQRHTRLNAALIHRRLPCTSHTYNCIHLYHQRLT